MAGSQMSMKRIKKEILDLSKEDMGEIQLTPSEKSIYEWQATIPGPTGSPYAGGMFRLAIHLPNDYPFSAPKVVFLTPIYHPNVSSQGHICIDILKAAWSPALSLFKVVLSLSSLLTDPNPKDPLVPEIAKQYLQNRPVFNKRARELTAKHAMGNEKSSDSKYVAASNSGRATRPAPPPSTTSSSGLFAGLMNFATGLRGSGAPRQPEIAVGTPVAAPRIIPNTPYGATSTSTVSGATVPVTMRNSRVQHNASVEVIDLDDSPPPTPVARAGTKRRREEEVDTSADPRESTRRRPNPATSSSSGAEEVIVIDDD